jgi:hypothetical protein
MQARVTLVGAAAIPCGRIQRARDSALQALEHEALAGCVTAAMRDAGLAKEAIGALVFTHPRPYTQQRYFGTFMANYLGRPDRARAPAEAPYRVGIVDLDDGVRIATRLLGVEQEDGFAVGERAEIVVLAYDDGVLFAARVRA